MLDATTRATAIEALEYYQTELTTRLVFSSMSARDRGKLARIDRAIEALTRGGGWQPVEGFVMVELGPGTTVVFRDGSCMAFGDEHPYPNGYALCRYVPQAAGLPMPDGPGFWAGKSKHREFVVHWTYFREDGNAICVCWQGDNYLTRYPLEQFKHDYRDVTWFKLTMPWESPAQAGA